MAASAEGFQLAATSRSPMPTTRAAAIAMNEIVASKFLSDGKTPTAGMTVQEAKEAFQSSFGNRILSMPLQAFIGEMLQSSTYAMASRDYRYSPVMALGFVRLCDTFLTMTDDDTKLQVQTSLCAALQYPGGFEGVTKDAAALLAAAEGKDEDGLLALADIKGLTPFKYTYISGAGLCALMLDAGLTPETSIAKWSDELGLNCKGALERDYDYFRTSIQKLSDMKEMLKVMKVSADKKKEKAEEPAAGAETVRMYATYRKREYVWWSLRSCAERDR